MSPHARPSTSLTRQPCTKSSATAAPNRSVAAAAMSRRALRRRQRPRLLPMRPRWLDRISHVRSGKSVRHRHRQHLTQGHTGIRRGLRRQAVPLQLREPRLDVLGPELRHGGGTESVLDPAHAILVLGERAGTHLCRRDVHEPPVGQRLHGCRAVEASRRLVPHVLECRRPLGHNEFARPGADRTGLPSGVVEGRRPAAVGTRIDRALAVGGLTVDEPGALVGLASLTGRAPRHGRERTASAVTAAVTLHEPARTSVTFGD